MKKGLRVLFGCMVFLMVSVSLTWSEEGVTDTEIHIGQWGPQTGLAAAWGSGARGTGDSFKWINETGGTHGRKIVSLMFDEG